MGREQEVIRWDVDPLEYFKPAEGKEISPEVLKHLSALTPEEHDRVIFYLGARLKAAALRHIHGVHHEEGDTESIKRKNLLKDRAFIGRLLRDRRMKAGFNNLTLFAHQRGVSPSYISRVENGSVPISREQLSGYINEIGEVYPGEDLQQTQAVFALLQGRTPFQVTLNEAIAITYAEVGAPTPSRRYKKIR